MSTATASSRPAGNGRLRVKKRFVLALLVLAGAVALGYYLHTRGKVSTDNAQVDGHIHMITPRVTGYVTEVLVADNQLVKAGQPLARLDPVEFEVALAQERAALAALRQGVPLERDQTRFKVSGATASRDSAAQSEQQAAQSERAAAREADSTQSILRQAQLDFARISSLAKTQVVAQAELDAARTALEGCVGAVLARRIEDVKFRVSKLEPHEVRLFSSLASQRTALEALDREIRSIADAGREAEAILGDEKPDPEAMPGRVL